MSANLMWAPAKRDKQTLPDALKFILRDHCCLDSDKQTWEKDQIPYLRGLAHANVEGAQELIDAIDTHGAVEIWLEY